MNIEKIRNLSPKTINTIVESKGLHTEGLTQDMVDYILQLNRASELLKSPDCDGSQLSVARVLQAEFPTLSLRTARRRVSDCIAYLYSEADNTADNWHEFYADKMDMLGRAAEQNGDLEAARRCYQQAHDYRIQAAEGRIEPDRVQFKRILVSPDVDAERMGLGTEGLRELMQHAADIIQKSAIPQKEKERTLREIELETGIEDVNFE